MKKRIIAVLSVFILFVQNTMQAQTQTTAVPFITIIPDSRAGGMGETGVAIADNVWAVFWNPAGLAFQQGSELALTHTQWLPGLGLSDIWIAHVAYKQPVEMLDGVIGGQLTYLNLGEFIRTSASGPDPIGKFTGYELAVAATYSTNISDQLGIGTTARFIYSHLADQGAGMEVGSGTASGFCFDVGLLWKPYFLDTTMSFGLKLANVGPNISYVDREQADPLPMSLRLGVAYKALQSEYNNLTVTAEVNRLLVRRRDAKSDEFYEAIFTTWSQGNISEQLRRFNSMLGVEYWYGSPKLIAVRAGYFYEDPREGNRKFWTVGAGIRYDLYGFDFGYISTLEGEEPLDGTLRLTLSIGWDSGE
ncbi:MAG: type IX secretion system outer membrane channel protein PorV [Bacteroidetes bacterium]|nr:type IX secretion system outer membrane channel protein PorV [Bacteroidota bacterium]